MGSGEGTYFIPRLLLLLLLLLLLSWTLCTAFLGHKVQFAFFLHGIKLINPHWRWLTYVRKKKKRGLPFGAQLPRDGMKILQWSSNPKLPSKNIPLPPERDPDLFACRAGAGRGWAARTGGQVGDRQGQGDGRSGQVQFTGLGRSLK